MKLRKFAFIPFVLVFLYCVAFAYVKMTEAKHFSDELLKMNEKNTALKEQLDACRSPSAELGMN